MRSGARGEVEALRRFLAAPRRVPVHHTAGWHWIARCLFFGLLVVAVNVAVDTVLLDPLSDWLKIESVLPDKVTPRFLFEAVVLAPLLEELVYRAGLRSAGYTLYAGLPLVFFVATPWGVWTYISLALGAAALAVYLLRRRTNARHPGARYASGHRFLAHYRWVFWGYTTLFAAMHLGNYTWQGAPSLLLPMLVLPQFVMAAVAGYLRLRDGLRSSILLHFVNNATALLAMTWVV